MSWVLAVVGVVAVAATGCSSSQPGQAQASPPSAAATSSSAALSLPPRPAALSTVGVDSCTLLPEAERAALEIDRPPTPAGPDAVVGGQGCGFSVAAWGIYGVDATADYTAAQWLQHTNPADNTISSVGGYPAVVTYKPIDPRSCFVVVDTSDTGLLYVPIRDRRATATDRDDLCGRALKAAGIALATLRAKQ